MSIAVDLDTLTHIARRLDHGRQDLERVASPSPPAPDAGAMAAVAASVVAFVCDCVAGLSEGLSVVAAELRESERAYRSTDDDVHDRFLRLGSTGR